MRGGRRQRLPDAERAHIDHRVAPGQAAAVRPRDAPRGTFPDARRREVFLVSMRGGPPAVDPSNWSAARGRRAAGSSRDNDGVRPSSPPSVARVLGRSTGKVLRWRCDLAGAR